MIEAIVNSNPFIMFGGFIESDTLVNYKRVFVKKKIRLLSVFSNVVDHAIYGPFQSKYDFETNKESLNKLFERSIMSYSCIRNKLVKGFVKIGKENYHYLCRKSDEASIKFILINLDYPPKFKANIDKSGNNREVDYLITSFINFNNEKIGFPLVLVKESNKHFLDFIMNRFSGTIVKPTTVLEKDRVVFITYFDTNIKSRLPIGKLVNKVVYVSKRENDYLHVKDVKTSKGKDAKFIFKKTSKNPTKVHLNDVFLPIHGKVEIAI